MVISFSHEGWVPVDGNNKQYCWHASVVNYPAGVALVLRVQEKDEGLLEIVSVPLADLMEQTLELIGTNVNGNPYGKYFSIEKNWQNIICACMLGFQIFINCWIL